MEKQTEALKFLEPYIEIGQQCFKRFTKRQAVRFYYSYIKKNGSLANFDEAFQRRLDVHNAYWEKQYSQRMVGFKEKVIGTVEYKPGLMVFRSEEHQEYRIKNPCGDVEWARKKAKDYCEQEHVNIDIDQLIATGTTRIIIRPHL